MGRAFLSMDDVRMRLHKTVCMYKGEPVYVNVDDIGTDHKVRICPLVATPNASLEKYKLVDYREDAFDYRFMELGYLNYKGNCWFLSRNPERKNHQGLKYDCVSASPGDLNDHYSYINWFFSAGMNDTILGKYPKLSEALDKLRDDAKGVAVHRDFAVRWIDTNNIGMFYREQLISIKEDVTDKFNLIPKRSTSYIQRFLEAAGL
jgi:hypothetical protein